MVGYGEIFSIIVVGRRIEGPLISLEEEDGGRLGLV